jgi:DNA segregation ATPase FtsK/SpoIIIE-like protein
MEIKELARKIDELNSNVKKLSDKQNSQYTDIMVELRKINEYLEEQEYEDDGVSFDDLYDEAKEKVLKARKASTSYLQRALGIGYSRACNLIDKLEKEKIIGPNQGAKPREILVKYDKKLADAFKAKTADEEDELYEKAKSATLKAGKVTTSYLQRVMGIGYARSARLVDLLEENGVIEGGSGSKPRKVIK